MVLDITRRGSRFRASPTFPSTHGHILDYSSSTDVPLFHDIRTGTSTRRVFIFNLQYIVKYTRYSHNFFLVQVDSDRVVFVVVVISYRYVSSAKEVSTWEARGLRHLFFGLRVNPRWRSSKRWTSTVTGTPLCVRSNVPFVSTFYLLHHPALLSLCVMPVFSPPGPKIGIASRDT